MRQFEQAHHPGTPTGTAADHALLEGHQPAVGLAEETAVGRGRRGLAAIEGAHRPAVEQHQESAAADAGRLRLDQRQHHLRRDRRIDRRPPARRIDTAAAVAASAPSPP